MLVLTYVRVRRGVAAASSDRVVRSGTSSAIATTCAARRFAAAPVALEAPKMGAKPGSGALDTLTLKSPWWCGWFRLPGPERETSTLSEGAAVASTSNGLILLLGQLIRRGYVLMEMSGCTDVYQRSCVKYSHGNLGTTLPSGSQQLNVSIATLVQYLYGTTYDMLERRQ